MKFVLLPYTLSISCLLADSFSKGPICFVSCTFPFVILNDTTFSDFISTAIFSLNSSHVSISSMQSSFFDTVS